MSNEYMAPGHPYITTLGTGIEWTPGQVRRWEGGEVVATAADSSTSAWDFWHDLAFAQVFPDVTHWWFRSLWTGRVQFSMPDPNFVEHDTLWGWVTFDVLDQPRRPYSVHEGALLEISPPFPPNEEQIANLPLRLTLARCILAVLRDELAPNTWIGVTSLVASEMLIQAFPATAAKTAEVYGAGWCLTHGAETVAHLPRTALCQALGLESAA